ncbi:hypothetical protein [Myxococcus qinghaiensis]|uniref:hypothetical protein n=1 Tax=Myxococcus qinghaiensis TaxID=2906758 RepID=UPI0020A7CD49|nr:hypothetical protein [Myxococcus qinghaiensis]MCP3163130.1 hypothetical protein [Myxococcus qinghaiensis]
MPTSGGGGREPAALADAEEGEDCGGCTRALAPMDGEGGGAGCADALAGGWTRELAPLDDAGCADALAGGWTRELAPLDDAG